MRKGISLGAIAIMLVFAAVAVLAMWAASFTQEATSGVSEESENLVSCSKADFTIKDLTYVASEGELRFVIVNEGTVDLANISIDIWSMEGNVTKRWVEGPKVTISQGRYTLGNLSFPSSNDIRAVQGYVPGCRDVEHTVQNIGSE